MGQARQKSPSTARDNFLVAAIKQFIAGEVINGDSVETLNSCGEQARLYGIETAQIALDLRCSPYVFIGLDNEFTEQGFADLFPGGRLFYIKDRLKTLTAEESEIFREKYQVTPDMHAKEAGKSKWYEQVRSSNQGATELQPKARP